MEFYAAFNVLSWNTADEAAQVQVEWLRELANRNVVTVMSRKAVEIHGIRGVRVVVSYRDKDSRSETICDEIILLRSGEPGDPLGDEPDFAYTFGVTTTAKEYPAGRLLFERVLATARFSTPDE